MKISVLLALVLASFSALAADKPMERAFSAPPDKAFDAAVSALEDLNWRVQLANKKGGLLMFNTGEWELSGKARCTVSISDGAAGGSLVQVAVNRKYAAGFAKNDRVARKLFEKMQRRLEQPKEAAPASH